MTKFAWTTENTASLMTAVEGIEIVSQDQAASLADQLGTTARSVGAKLRKLGVQVATAAKAVSAWTTELEAALTELLTANEGKYTYAELAEVFGNGFSAKQLQGKVLHMELTALVKKSDKKAPVRQYTAEEEDTFVQMVNADMSIEDIAMQMGRTVPQIRGKALSMVREGRIAAQPRQAVVAQTAPANIFEGVDVAQFTVAELAEKLGKAERSIKASLTRKALTAKDYDGAAKAKKNAEKRAASEE